MKNQETKVDLTLFSLAIDSKSIFQEQVPCVTSVNCLEDLPKEKQEEVKQYLAQAADILVESLRGKLSDYYNKK